MSSRNERFNDSCLSLNEFAESIDAAKSCAFSDGGEGMRRIFRGSEWDPQAVAAEARTLAEERRRVVGEIVQSFVLWATWLGLAHELVAAAARISAKLEVGAWQSVRLLCAEFCLTVAEKEGLIAVLECIVANGRNRRESIWRLSMVWHVKLGAARRRYYRNGSLLQALFSPNEIKGETHIDKV